MLHNSQNLWTLHFRPLFLRWLKAHGWLGIGLSQWYLCIPGTKRNNFVDGQYGPSEHQEQVIWPPKLQKIGLHCQFALGFFLWPLGNKITLKAQYLCLGGKLSNFSGDQKCSLMENEHFWSPENFDNFPPRQRYFGLKVFLTVLQQGEIEPKTGPNYGPRASNCRATKGGIRVIFGWGFLLGPHFFVSRSGMNPSHPTIFTKTTIINNRGLQKAFWAFFLSQG